jgi:hypothetical protein
VAVYTRADGTRIAECPPDRAGEGVNVHLRVSTWNELNDALFGGTWQASLGRFRASEVYRGVSDGTTADLTTSLMRLGGDYAEMEDHLLRNFRKYAHLDAREAIPGDTAWHWLAIAQHHGLPTRLLDWTYSPFVALHFATASLAQFDLPGVVWCINHERASEFLPPSLREILDEEGANVFTAEMLQRGAGSLPAFDQLAGAGDPFVAFFEPPSLDARIVNQWALFSLMSSATISLDDWLAHHPDLLRKIVIPAELKWEVRDKLDQANITERVLFPGLDGLSSWLKRYYSPRTPGAYPAADPDGEQGTSTPVRTKH